MKLFTYGCHVGRKPSNNHYSQYRRRVIWKTKKLNFEQYQNEGEDEIYGAFISPQTEEWYLLYDKFVDIIESTEYLKEYVAKLLEIIDKEPCFIDAYAHIAGQLLEHDNVKIAEEYSRKGWILLSLLFLTIFQGASPGHTLRTVLFSAFTITTLFAKWN